MDYEGITTAQRMRQLALPQWVKNLVLGEIGKAARTRGNYTLTDKFLREKWEEFGEPFPQNSLSVIRLWLVGPSHGFEVAELPNMIIIRW